MEQHVVRSSATQGLAPAALEDVHERFLRLAGSGMDRAYRLAGLVLGDGSEAEDAVQDALLRAWNSAGSLRDASGFEAWFDRILVNGCRDRLRRRKILRFIPIDATHDTVPVRMPSAPSGSATRSSPASRRCSPTTAWSSFSTIGPTCASRTSRRGSTAPREPSSHACIERSPILRAQLGAER